MPRKSAAELSVVSIAGRGSRLRPPGSLSEPERAAFCDLVASCKPGHFQASDLPLICRYVEAIVLAEEASGHLRRDGAVVGGRVSPWIVIQEKQNRALVALAMRLRLSPQARAPNNSTRRAPGEVSHYEKMRIGHDDSES